MNIYAVNRINTSTYANNKNIVTIDLKNKPWYAGVLNNCMVSAFNNCTNLQKVINISNAVTNMHTTFYNCTSLINAPIIPNSVTDMYGTFIECSNLINAPTIPNSVTNMVHCFSRCTSLVNAPEIPNSVTNMSHTFAVCSNLTTAPSIPNSVTAMQSTFLGCSNLVNAPSIPNSVTNMYCTFDECSNLVNAPTIPNTVVNMSGTFERTNLITISTIPNLVTNMKSTFRACNSLTGDINILSNQITNAVNCFADTRLTKNIYIPYRNSDGTLSATYNSFIAAGYDEIGTQNSVYLKTLTPILTINPTPANATITFSSSDYIYKNATSIVVNRGTEVSYTVSKPNYTSVTNTITLKDDTNINVDLATDNYTVTIATTPADAVVTFDTSISGGTVSGKSITVPYNTEITYSVSKTGYQTLSNQTYTVVRTEVINATSLTKNSYTLTINPDPADAIVTLTADGYTQSNNSIIVPYETSVNYSVSRSGYATQSGSEIVTSTKTTNISLTKNNYTLTVNTNPSDAIIDFSTGTVSGHSVTVPYNTVVTYTVSKTGYITSDVQTYTVTQTETITGPTLVPDTAILTVTPTPSDATVVLTASGYSQDGNTIEVPTGTIVHYIVSKTDYTTDEGDVLVDTTKTISPTLNKIYYAWDYNNSTVYTDTANPTTSTIVLTNSLTPKSGYTISNVTNDTIGVNHNQTTSIPYQCWGRNTSITVNSLGTLTRNPSIDSTRTVTSRTYGTYQQYTFGWGNYIGLDPFWYGQSAPLSQIYSGNTAYAITAQPHEYVYVKESSPNIGSLAYNSNFVQVGSVSSTGTTNCGNTTYISGFVNGGQWTRNYVIVNGNTYYRYSSGDTSGTETTTITENYTRNSSKDITN